MKPAVRKLFFTAHITLSIGWFGAVAAFLVLAITGWVNKNPETFRAAYISMNLLTWFIIIPFCLGSLLTGLIQSLFTPWGLFKHYWILVKFLLTAGATFLLFLHTQQISYMAEVASKNLPSNPEIDGIKTKLFALSAGALLYFIAVIIISVYKPWGMTPYGLRKQQEKQKEESELRFTNKKSFVKYVAIGFICLFLLFIILHLLRTG